MENQALFSSKDKSEKLKCRLLQLLFGALKVKIRLFVFQQTIGKTELYIQHERATESQLGDKFGASIETNSTRITGYCEHFFTDIAPGGVADHMKIKYVSIVLKWRIKSFEKMIELRK